MPGNMANCPRPTSRKSLVQITNGFEASAFRKITVDQYIGRFL